GRPFQEFFRVAESLAGIPRFADGDEERLDALMQYGATNGIIREELARHLLVDEGLEVSPESIVVTVGCQEAMMICLLALCRPGRDVLLVSDPGYIGIVGVAELLGIDIAPVRCGESGLDLSDLRARLAAIKARGKRPRILYDIPDFSNPSGTLLS